MLFDNKPLPTYYLRSDVHRMCLSTYHLQAYASYTGTKPDNVKTRYFNLTGTSQQFTFEVGHDELWANHAWHRLAARVSGRRLAVLGLDEARSGTDGARRVRTRFAVMMAVLADQLAYRRGRRRNADNDPFDHWVEEAYGPYQDQVYLALYKWYAHILKQPGSPMSTMDISRL